MSMETGFYRRERITVRIAPGASCSPPVDRVGKILQIAIHSFIARISTPSSENSTKIARRLLSRQQNSFNQFSNSSPSLLSPSLASCAIVLALTSTTKLFSSILLICINFSIYCISRSMVILVLWGVCAV